MTRTLQQVEFFSNVSVSILRDPAINLGGIWSFVEARLGEILPVKHQRQALLPWPMFPSSPPLAFQPWKKKKPQETGLRLWMAGKVRSKRNSQTSWQKLE